MTTGPRAGTHFLLSPEQSARIGRGLDCDIVLTDALSSRVHATVLKEDGGWWVRDAGSRNGTFLNGQKIDEAQLDVGGLLRVGSTEFKFIQSEDKIADNYAIDRTQTLVRDRLVDRSNLGILSLDKLRQEEKSTDLNTLYQLTLKLMGCTDPDEVIRQSLGLLHERTGASFVGFLWVSDDGQLKPKMIIPEGASSHVRLNNSLTDMVIRQSKAVWVDDQKVSGGTTVLQHYADALCVPLLDEGKTIGAIHLYLDRGRFRQSDFDIAIPIANILTVALVRARQEALLRVDNHRLTTKAAAFDELIGESKPMTDLKSRIGRVARATGSVLIRGESGSGKELVARAVHKGSARADRPMLTVNCAALPRDLMESQLFGHKKGSFTGADADHIGLFQQAHTGTLFLDEVGEMTLEGQAKLLRILEGHPFLPVGGTKEIHADVRVIAATNRDLAEFVRDGKFREDLFYRLSVFELYIPPLRDRGTDIELLVGHFLEHFSKVHGRRGMTLSPDARQKLLMYSWPGNVRQLRNVIDSAVVMAEGTTILPDDLGLRDAGTSSNEMETLRIDFWERKLIAEALKRTGRKVPEAAQLLGLGRATLYRKIDEFGIDRKAEENES